MELVEKVTRMIRKHNEGTELYANSLWNQINWARIGRAVDFYTSNGFRYVEVPWIVNDKYVQVTYPKDCPENHAFQTSVGTLVGSAEQSFICLRDLGCFDENQLLVAVSPCFRDFQPDDKIHRTYFMKVELYSSNKHVLSNDLMLLAGTFFEKEGVTLEFKETDSVSDWEVAGYEIGSYGNRKWNNFSWSYGTGLAEPRFSQSLLEQKRFEFFGPNEKLGGL